MNQIDVQTICLAQFQAALVGAYPSILCTSAAGAAVAQEANPAGGPWLLMTLHDHDPNRFQDEDNWQFMVQMSAGLQTGSQATTTAVNDADVALCEAAMAAINSDEGYVVLRDAGLLQAEMKAMAETQMAGGPFYNPHLLMFSTY